MPRIKVEITRENITEAIEGLVDAQTEADRIDVFAAFLDDITPAGPLEMFDGPAYEVALTLAAKALKRDPDKVAARKARRARRKAARRGKGENLRALGDD